MDAGRKDDNGKLKWNLLPWDCMEELVRVYTEGAKIYGERNWELGIDTERWAAALMRHFVKRMKGYIHNKEDEGNMMHMAQVAFCALAIIRHDLKIERNRNGEKVDTESD